MLNEYGKCDECGDTSEENVVMESKKTKLRLNEDQLVNLINKIVKNYKLSNSEPESIKILLLNAEYCASGINLENTSDIVIYHSMTPAKTKQIIGRGQRPGRTSQLNVWKLCYENES